MKNIFNSEKIAKFFSLSKDIQRVSIIAHTNPDGDAIGSGLGLLRALRQLQVCRDVRFIVPNEMPSALKFLDTDRDVEVFKNSIKEYTAYIAASDLIIYADFNDVSRLEAMGEALERNFIAPRVLIDHHIAPPTYDINFHSEHSSSTALLVFYLIKALGVQLTQEIAKPLYTGMLTDTGGFMFSNLSPELYSALSEISATGVDIVSINQAIFNNQSEERVRLSGYLLNEKMVVDLDHKAAYITLTEEEKTRFNFQIGNTEGLVNIPQTIAGVDFSALLIENKDHIKLSLRSLGGVDVNELSRANFNGGGHRNAAGGKFFGSMDTAVEKLKSLIEQM